MKHSDDVHQQISSIPVIEVAKALGIRLKGTKAMCFTGHDKKTPSLSFSKTKNIWKCFGCGIGGGGISLVMEYTHCSYIEAIDWFRRNFYITHMPDIWITRRNFQIKSRTSEIAQPVVYSVNTAQSKTENSEIYSDIISNCGEITTPMATKYLEDHGITIKLAETYCLKQVVNDVQLLSQLKKKWSITQLFEAGVIWDMKDSKSNFIWKPGTIIFPFYHNNHVVYLQGRQFDKEPKFLNLLKIHKPLYNKDVLEKAITGSVVFICEGVPDTLAVMGLNYQAVGVLGASSFKDEWVEYFRKFKIIILPDGDTGGETFASSLVKMFNRHGMIVWRKRLPSGQDIASLIKMEGKK